MELGLQPYGRAFRRVAGAAAPTPSWAGPRADASVLDAVDASMAALPERYISARAPAGPRRYRVRVHGCSSYTVVVDGTGCRVRRGELGPAHAELSTDAASWLDLASGDRNGLDLFFHGLLEVRGDLNEALRLETLFAPPPASAGALVHPALRRHVVSGVEIATFEAGPATAPAVLFLHGLGASKASLLPAIAGLADTYRVIAMDFPGFGESAAPVAAPYDAPWLAGMAAGVLDAVGVERAAVVGNSLGGRVAVELALAAPHRVDALALLCPAVAFDEYRLLRPLLSASRMDLALGTVRWPLGGAVPRRMVDSALRSLFVDPGRVPAANLVAARDDVLRALTSRRRRLALLACTRRLGLEAPRRFWPRVAGLAAPSLWIFGDGDRLVSPSYAAIVRSRLPAASVQIWESCGHVPQFEHPVRTVAALHGFLAEHSSAQPPSASSSSAGSVTGLRQANSSQT